MKNPENLVLIAGNSNKELSQEIANLLNIPLADTTIGSFSDQETKIEINHNVRGEDVFIICPTSQPANQHYMELFLLVDAIKRSSAKRITAVIPYVGYSRQDAKPGPRTPISSRLIADLLETSGVDRILTVDIHSRQQQGFFSKPLDNMYAMPILKRDIQKRFNTDNLIIVSPDAGGASRARSLAQKLGVDMAIIDKRRDYSKSNVSEVMNLVGDVNGKDCVIFDDMVDTAGTLCNGADALIANGANTVHAYATHGILSGPATERLDNTDSITTLTVTNTVQYPIDGGSKSNKVLTVSVAPLLAKAIKNIADETSVSELLK